MTENRLNGKYYIASPKHPTSSTSLLSAYYPNRKVPGFTLLEVLASVGILALLLFTLISSQSQILYVLGHTDTVLTAQKIAREEINKIIRTTETVTPGQSRGGFAEEHPMFGSRWKKTITESHILKIPILRVEYLIIWEEGGTEKNYAEFTYVYSR